MIGIVLYIIATIVTSLLLNRLQASSDGEKFAGEFIPFQVMGGLFWPIVLPLALLCISVYYIAEFIKSRSESK